MATKPELAASPAKSKKMLFVVIAVVVLAMVGGGVFFYMKNQRSATGAEEPAPAKAAHAASKTPPAYLPLDSMVVNLADPGGERVAQIGITLEVSDSHASDAVKAYLPLIRSSILILISQRTSEDLLTQEGKEKLAKDILREVSIPFGGGDEVHEDETAAAKKKKPVKKVVQVEYPVVGVLFSSFIIQ